MTLYVVRGPVGSTTASLDSFADNQNACVAPSQRTLCESDVRWIEPGNDTARINKKNITLIFTI